MKLAKDTSGEILVFDTDGKWHTIAKLNQNDAHKVLGVWQTPTGNMYSLNDNGRT